MTKITLKDAFHIGKRLGVNFDVIPVEILRYGMSIEMEHKSVIGSSKLKAAKIALAHLEEFPNYYEALEKMENKLKRQWKGKRKPRIFIS
jgi:hypothetical protein